MYSREKITLFPVMIYRGKRSVLILSTITQMTIDRRRINNLAGVQQMMRIKKFFCFSESFIDLFSIKFFQKTASHYSISMLTAPGSTIMHDTMKNFVAHFPELNNILCNAHIQHRFDVNDTNAGMRIIIHFN